MSTPTVLAFKSHSSVGSCLSQLANCLLKRTALEFCLFWNQVYLKLVWEAWCRFGKLHDILSYAWYYCDTRTHVSKLYLWFKVWDLGTFVMLLFSKLFPPKTEEASQEVHCRGSFHLTNDYRAGHSDGKSKKVTSSEMLLWLIWAWRACLSEN